MDTHTIVLYLLRWVHIVAGITWIGHLYFFNFVNGIFGKALDGDTKKKAVPELMPRALFWFRWGAMYTWLTGWAYIFWKLFIASSAGFTGEGGLFTSTWGQWITIGAALGTVMWYNVWFIIWPAQQKIIPWIKKGEAPPEMAALVAKATKASKINTYFSAPLLFCMTAASHLPVINPVLIILAFVIGFGVIHRLYAIAPKVKLLN